jgi:hypothetical protein
VAASGRKGTLTLKREDDMNAFALVLGGLLGVCALTIVVLVALDRRRRQALRAAGASLGLVAVERGVRVALPAVPAMRKRRLGLAVALRGEWRGVAVEVIDIFFPAVEAVARQTVLVARLPHFSCPEFAVIERHANQYLPSGDLPTVDDAPEALRKHWIAYARGGRWPFADTLATWLGSGRGRRHWWGTGWAYEGHGNLICVYRRNVTASPGHLAAWLDEAMAEATGFAEHSGRARTSTA